MSENRCIINPEAEGFRKIWRYMDFVKFMSLIETSTLYLPRADQFNDPFEASYPKAAELAYKKKHPGTEEYYPGPPFSELMQHAHRHTFVSCWYGGDFESVAMWNQYANELGAICIQSNVEKLREALGSGSQTRPVRYMDYDDPNQDYPPPDHLIFCKRLSFETEKEIRGIVVFPPETHNQKLSYAADEQGFPKGIERHVNILDFIEAVHVGPGSSTRFRDLVQNICRRYGLSVCVKNSALDAVPTF